MDALNHGQFDHPLLDTFDLVRISNEDLDVGGRFTRNLAAINGVMSFRIRDGQRPPMAAEQEISIQAMRREGSLTPCYNADRYGTDITVIGNGQPQLYGLIKMLAGGMQMVAGPNGTAAAHGTKGIVARVKHASSPPRTMSAWCYGSTPAGWSRASPPGMVNPRARYWNSSRP